MKLVKENSPVLRMRTLSLFTSIASVKPYIKDMKRIMKKHKGVGLAAPQVGIEKRFFISDIDGMRVVINPKILGCGADRTCQREGCLSFPNRFRRVSRANLIDVEWTDIKGRVKKRTLIGLEARVFQHETDHLNGICIFD